MHAATFQLFVAAAVFVERTQIIRNHVAVLKVSI